MDNYNQNQGNYNQGNYQGGYAPAYNPYDHTAEFTQDDISKNKVYAMSVYLLGWIGIVIALLASNSSPYAAFHVRQGVKFTICSTLLTLISLILCWTFIIPIAAGIMSFVLFIFKIICFVQICCGKAVEPILIRNLGFMN